jgi:hypothetical protein
MHRTQKLLSNRIAAATLISLLAVAPVAAAFSAVPAAAANAGVATIAQATNGGSADDTPWDVCCPH